MKKQRITPEIIFYIAALTGIAVMFAMLIISEGKAMYVMGYGESLACDFWNHIRRLLNYESLYGNQMDSDAIFPPLAYCFLQFFAQCLRHFDSSVDVAVTGYGILVLNLYLLIFMAAFVLVLQYSYHTTRKLFQIALPFLFLFSYPFWGCAFERGNPVIYAMLFLLIGMMVKDHQNKFVREMALISVAIAAGFKIYPALFGLIWLEEKRYKEAARLLIYGLAAFFIPFAFFGGIHGVVDYAGTFIRYLGKGMYSKTSILGNCMIVFGEQGKNIGKAILLLWIIWVIYCLFTRGGVFVENNRVINQYANDCFG